MPLILNIDTALETATVSLAENGIILQAVENTIQKDHAAWLHPAIQNLMKTVHKNFDQLDAIAVNHGPGSYTGLRVGLAAAKGFCYSLNIPMIVVSSLEILARSALNQLKDLPDIISPADRKSLLVAPMIDALRMEVFTAVYNVEMQQVLDSTALVLSEDSYSDLLEWHKILFLGNGSKKFQSVCHNGNAFFPKLNLNSSAMSELSYNYFIGNNFVGIAYAEPLYLKEFYTRQ